MLLCYIFLYNMFSASGWVGPLLSGYLFTMDDDLGPAV